MDTLSRLVFVLTVGTWSAWTSPPASGQSSPVRHPQIEILSLPPYGRTATYRAGSRTSMPRPTRWRPTFSSRAWASGRSPTPGAPLTDIQPDGSFSVDVVTGGLDDIATHYVVALVPAGQNPPIAQGDASLPSDPAFLAMDTEIRFGRVLDFAGRRWGVKEAPLPVGPGGNYFSSSPSDVFVDAQGRLHLTVRFRDGVWWSSEVVLLEELQWGDYWFVTEKRGGRPRSEPHVRRIHLGRLR